LGFATPGGRPLLERSKTELSKEAWGWWKLHAV